MSMGVCVGWKDGKGFGFVRPNEGGGGDVFVHARDIVNASELKQGDRVSFDVVTDERRGKPLSLVVPGKRSFALGRVGR